MDLDAELIVDLETVQVTQTTSSNAMEKFACKKLLKRLKEAEIQISVFCTDRHPGIQKLMTDTYPDIIHQYDMWHMSKSVSKKLVQKAKKKG